MPAYTDVKTVVDNLVALIKEFAAKLKSFIDGFQKKLSFGEDKPADETTGD